MNSLLTIACLFVCALIVITVTALGSTATADYGVVTVFDASNAVLVGVVLSAIAGFLIYRQPESGQFLLRIFICAVLVRLLLATAIFVFHGQAFFGGDALTYDTIGNAQLQVWSGETFYESIIKRFVERSGGSGWGMIYMVAAVYALIGRNMLAIQFINAVLGAATGALIFLSTLHVFNNTRVARFAAISVSFYPSLVLWSSQGLKDAPIVFFLALSILATLKLSQRFNATYIAVLSFSLFALLSLRFYIFYMILASVAGALVIGVQKLTTTSFIRQFAVIVSLGLTLTYLGVTRYTDTQIQRFATLERVQLSRLDASRSAQSGFGKEADVSTGEGALSTIPLGLIYLLFAPFPWQLVSLRQSITLPEMILWWASFPLLVLGLWFSIKYRLRQISPILIFVVMLSLAYSILQGNVGNAYRQRAQLLVFYFIFVAVGWVLMLEKREERKRLAAVEPESLATRIASPSFPRR